MAVQCNYSLVQRHSYSVSLAVADMADMDFAPAPVHTYSVQSADNLAADNLANIVVNAVAVFASLQTPDTNRYVV